MYNFLVENNKAKSKIYEPYNYINVWIATVI